MPTDAAARAIDRTRTRPALVTLLALLALLALSPPSPARADTKKCGAVCDETWTQSGSPYIVTCDVTVAATCSLTIESGVEVRVVSGSPRVVLDVEGSIDVQGTAQSPVTFRSDETAPAASDWDGLHLTGSAIADLDHLHISHAQYGIFARGASVTTLTSVHLGTNYDGLYVEGSGPPSVTATDCSFTGNSGSGVNLRGNPNPDVSITASSIHSNGGSYDLITYGYADSWNTIVPVRENWWGTTDTETISGRIIDHRYATSRPFVDYCGFLDGPGGVPARDAHCPDLVTCEETQTWDLVDKPYLIVTDLWVCPDATLRIEPGVEVQAAKTSGRLDFLVRGTLDVDGAPGSPVILTSGESSPSAGDWIGPQFSTGSSSTLEHVEIRYAERGIWAHGDSVVALDNVTATLNEEGLFVQGSGPPAVTATDCSFTGNSNSGVYLYGTPDPDVSITKSSIHSNGGSYDLITYGYADPWHTIVPVRDNWWGTTDTEAISGRIIDHRYATNRPFVDYCGFLDGPGGSTARKAYCPDLVTCGETQVWSLVDKPYLIATDLWVCPGATLRVEPGVEVRAAKTSQRLDFLVEGSLEVVGTRDAPVVLSSDVVPPETGDWIGVFLGGDSTSTIENARIMHADHGIRLAGASHATLLGVEATLNTNGIHVQGFDAPSLRAAGCKITNNEDNGLLVYGSPNPDVSITRSSLHSNTRGYDLNTNQFADPDNSVVWALDNWWGTTDLELIGERIFDRDDSPLRPRVAYRGFGTVCELALGEDGDGDGHPDFDDNCPDEGNSSQADDDKDGMGDACDPEPLVAPSHPCDGSDDVADGYLDIDGDGWGDPCDHQPTKFEAHPGAAEICDARDDDGDAEFGLDELVDLDDDFNLACGDCDDEDPELNSCGCELCLNGVDDDCDGFADEADLDCVPYPTCIELATGTDLTLTITKGACGGASLGGPFDVVRGRVGELALVGDSVDLGELSCVEGGLDWDRVTEYSARPNPQCDEMATSFFLARQTGAEDFGAASGGARRDAMYPDPPCP